MKKRITPCAMSAALLLGAITAISLNAGTGAVAGGATLASCVPAQMRVTHGAAQGTAGTTYIPLVFTNTGATCALWGVASVQPVLASRRALGPAARNQSMGEMPARHVLTRGRSVSVAFGVVETGNFTASSCVAREASGVVVSLASFVRPTYLRLPISVCTKRASTTTRLIVDGSLGN
jgi:hypothetical protein